MLKADRTGDLVVGDIIKINDNEYLYRGMNSHGGPGQSIYASAGIASAVFGPPVPTQEDIIIYFDIPTFTAWQKVGHRTPEEWNRMCQELGQELAGQK